MILAERTARVMAEANAAVAKAEAANAQADLSSSEALIAHLKLEIEKLRRELYGTRSERKARLLEQMELQLEDLEAAATEDELAAEKAAARTQTVQSFQRKRPSRKPFPDHLPRERVVIAAPEQLSLLRVGEAVEAGRGHHRDAGGDPAAVEGDPDGAGEVLVPGMRDDHAAAGAVPCDAARLRRTEPAGHDPVREVRPASAAEPPERTLQARRHRSERVDAGRPGRRLHDGPATAPCADRAPRPGCRAAARRRHHRADPGQGQDGHGAHLDLCPRRPAVWRSRTAGGALLRLARSTGTSIPCGIFKASPASCRPTPIAATTSSTIPRARRERSRPALCWAHARRQFFELADIAANARRGKNAAAISPVALEAVKRIDALFDIERDINGLSAEERLRVRQEQSAPLLAALEAWLREERSRLSRSASVAKPIDYMLKRWDRFARFIDDGRICLTNNAAERALRGFALGTKVVAVRRLRTRRRCSSAEFRRFNSRWSLRMTCANIDGLSTAMNSSCSDGISLSGRQVRRSWGPPTPTR